MLSLPLGRLDGVRSSFTALTSSQPPLAVCFVPKELLMQRRLNVIVKHLLSNKVNHFAHQGVLSQANSVEKSTPPQNSSSNKSQQQSIFPIVIEGSVRKALEQGNAVVALESTIVHFTFVATVFFQSYSSCCCIFLFYFCDCRSPMACPILKTCKLRSLWRNRCAKMAQLQQPLQSLMVSFMLVCHCDTKSHVEQMETQTRCKV